MRREHAMRRTVIAASLAAALLLAGCTATTPAVDSASARPTSTPPPSPLPSHAPTLADLVFAATYPETYEKGRAALQALRAAVQADCAPTATDPQLDALNAAYTDDMGRMINKYGPIPGSELIFLDHYISWVENVCLRPSE